VTDYLYKYMKEMNERKWSCVSQIVVLIRCEQRHTIGKMLLIMLVVRIPMWWEI